MVEHRKRDRFFPGVLIGLGSNPTVNAKNLENSMKINRGFNITGESFFYYESLKDSKVDQIIKSFYNDESSEFA